MLSAAEITSHSDVPYAIHLKLDPPRAKRELLTRALDTRLSKICLTMDEVMPSGVSGKLMVGGAIAVGTLAVFAKRSLRPESQLFGKTLVAGTDPNEIALTFDDGPNERSTLELLDVLARFGARATFFMIGKFVQQQPHIVREVQAAGHLIGNHTMTHPFLANKPLSLVQEEISRCNAALEDVLGEPVRYFRAPYGARRPAVLRSARALGLQPVQWNVAGNDWQPIGVDGILRKLEAGLRRTERQGRGANVLLHDGFDEQMGCDRTDTVRATAQLLRSMREQGKRAVAVDRWS